MDRELQLYGEGVKFHVHEFYTPKRVNAWAELLGKLPGVSFDLATVAPDDGQPWDFNNPEKPFKAEEIIRTPKALFLVAPVGEDDIIDLA